MPSLPQIGAHALNPLKGWPSFYAVDYQAPLADPSTDCPSGRVVSLNDNGKYVLGCGEAAVPHYVLRGTDALDTVGISGTSDAVPFASMMSAQKITCLVATGAFELASTEFSVDGSVTVADYKPNTKLTADANGVLKPATTTGEKVVGIVSRGVQAFGGVQMVCFWPANAVA